MIKKQGKWSRCSKGRHIKAEKIENVKEFKENGLFIIKEKY